MGQVEFLQKLEEELRSEMNDSMVREQLSFYREYINSEIASGKSEFTVIEELGDPWVIARNLIEVNAESPETVYEDGNSQREQHSQSGQGFKVFSMPQSRLGCLLTVVIIVMVFFFISSLALTVLRVFLPFIVPILLVTVLIKMFTRR